MSLLTTAKKFFKKHSTPGKIAVVATVVNHIVTPISKLAGLLTSFSGVAFAIWQGYFDIKSSSEEQESLLDEEKNKYQVLEEMRHDLDLQEEKMPPLSKISPVNLTTYKIINVLGIGCSAAGVYYADNKNQEHSEYISAGINTAGIVITAFNQYYFNKQVKQASKKIIASISNIEKQKTEANNQLMEKEKKQEKIINNLKSSHDDVDEGVTPTDFNLHEDNSSDNKSMFVPGKFE